MSPTLPPRPTGEGRTIARVPIYRHRLVRPLGGLCLIWLLLNLPVLLGVRVIPWDALDEFYPTVWFNVHQLRMGLAPWWNPYIYSGYPQIADPQGMLFSPLLMGWMLLRADPGVSWFDWGILLHLLLGAAALLAALRSKGANGFGALVGACVFMAGGAAAARLEHAPMIVAYGYAPVVLLALDRFISAPGWRRGLLVGIAAGALVTQLVQLTFLLALMLIGYAAVSLAGRWSSYNPQQRRRCAAGLLLATLCAAALGAPQLLFSSAFVLLSNRPVLPLSAAADASLDARALLTWLDPNAWHALRGTYDGPASRVEAFLYLGALPTLLLAWLAVAWRRGRHRRDLCFFVLVGLLASLYALGTHTPFYGWLYRWLPGIAQFRRPSDGAFLINFSCAVLAGLAAAQFDLRDRRQLTTVLLAVTAWLTLASLGMRDDDVHWQAPSLLAALFAGLAAWRLQRPGSERRAAIWLLMVLVVDYRCFNLNGAFNQGHDNARRFRREPAAAWLQARLAHAPGWLAPRIENFDAGIGWDNYVVLRGLASTQGYNPLRYALYDRWYGAREHGDLPRIVTKFNRGPDSKLADLLGVAYLVKAHPAKASTSPLPRSYAWVLSTDKFDIWQNSRVLPRLLTPTRAVLLPAGTALSPEQFEQTDFRTTLLLTPRDPNDRSTAAVDAVRCRARPRIAHVDAVATRLTVDTRSAQAGWLALGELDFPGWSADVDGREIPIHRANGMFRAVCVPGGSHQVTFAFHPWRMVAQAWSAHARSRHLQER